MIRRHIGINYSGTGQEVYTDGKWLAFMLEQILSNAIKYTPHGGVTIETAEEKDRFQYIPPARFLNNLSQYAFVS